MRWISALQTIWMVRERGEKKRKNAHTLTHSDTHKQH